MTATGSEPLTEEGRLVVDDAGHKIWYRRYGCGPRTLVGLHGGPGGSHKYLTRLGELAGDGLQVVLYDQLGGGSSDRPVDESLWSFPRFVEELEQVRTRLELGQIHLYGQSWGGHLALQYALDHPDALRSLILSNTGASIPEICHGMAQLRLNLGPELLATMTRHEAAEDYEHPDYRAALMQLYARHLRRSTPFDLERSTAEFEQVLGPELRDLGDPYFTMWGPHEFLCTGSLLEWNVIDRLGEIETPALVLCGFYDEVTVDVHRTLADRLPNNEFVIFGNSSHVTILEQEADAYLGVIRDFVRRRDAA